MKQNTRQFFFEEQKKANAVYNFKKTKAARAKKHSLLQKIIKNNHNDPPGVENNLARKDILLEGPDYGKEIIIGEKHVK